MSSAPATYIPRGFRWVHRGVARADMAISTAGVYISFVFYCLRYVPEALTKYRAQTVRAVSDLTWGRGAVIVGGGTALVMTVLGLAAGATVAIVAFGTLNMLGLGPLTGTVSSFAITREFAPLLAALGFAVQAGCRMTAEIGSMRISEEIDAVEVLGVRSIAFVVSTRMVAGVITIFPTFLVTVIVSYVTASVVTRTRGESAGAYTQYFDQFVNVRDLLLAAVKVVLFVVVVTLIHCYQGYFARGGPEGVGLASGHAIRASLVAIVVLDMALSIAFYGVASDLNFRG